MGGDWIEKVAVSFVSVSVYVDGYGCTGDSNQTALLL